MLERYCFKFPKNSLVFFAVGFACSLSVPLSAQVIPDNSLGNESSIVTPNATVKDISADLVEGGAIRGDNLFHSFSEFNISDGTGVYFANPDGISNILTRVTGNNISEIFGTLGVDGAANLFLLNPNGIVFGESAALDVSGSFFATTAESYLFENGLKFSATDPETAPLLTVNFAPGLQMGSNSGNITVRDRGHLKTGELLTPIIDYGTSKGLEVSQGQTLGLIASNIYLEGGIVKASGGDIYLAGVEEGKLQLDRNLQSWQLDTSEVQSFGAIDLVARTLVETSGFLTGNINLQGKNINIKEGSAVGIQNFGTQPTATVTIDATDTITLNTEASSSSPALIAGVILTENLNVGQGGDIVISGKNLLLDNGSGILARSFSNADTGNVNLDIERTIEVRGYSQQNYSFISLIGTNTFSSGDAGKVNVSARNLAVANGGVIAANNLGSGSGGTVNINVAEDTIVTGFHPWLVSPSIIGSTAYRTGNSGDLTIDTARLSISNGAAIDATTLAEGDGGQLTVNATESINVNGEVPEFGLNSAISSHALILSPILRQTLRLPDIPSGNSGDVTLNTPSLNLTDGGSVTVSNDGSGKSGSLIINSDRVLLNNNGNIIAFSAIGQGGNITLDIQDSLLLRNGSFVNAEARGSFDSGQSNIDGGNITINADTVTLLEDSNINANAFEGNGGNIDIFTQGLFVSPDSLITASSEFGLDGNVEIDEIDGDRQFELDRLSENVTDLTNLITVTCSADDNNALAVIGKGGIPNSPYQTQSLNTTWYDLRPVKQAEAVASIAAPIAEATATAIDADGELELVALTPLSTHRWMNSCFS